MLHTPTPARAATRLHPDRTARRHRHHRDSRSHPVPRLPESARKRPPRLLPVQPEADRPGRDPVHAGLRRDLQRRLAPSPARTATASTTRRCCTRSSRALPSSSARTSPCATPTTTPTTAPTTRITCGAKTAGARSGSGTTTYAYNAIINNRTDGNTAIGVGHANYRSGQRPAFHLQLARRDHHDDRGQQPAERRPQLLPASPARTTSGRPRPLTSSAISTPAPMPPRGTATSRSPTRRARSTTAGTAATPCSMTATQVLKTRHSSDGSAYLWYVNKDLCR